MLVLLGDAQCRDRHQVHLVDAVEQIAQDLLGAWIGALVLRLGGWQHFLSAVFAFHLRPRSQKVTRTQLLRRQTSHGRGLAWPTG
jgi:hypothetical protein